MGWNPANWQLTNTLQGQEGGITTNTVGKILGYANPGTTIPTAIADILGTGSQAQSALDNWNRQGSTSVLGTSTRAGEQGNTNQSPVTDPVVTGAYDANAAKAAQDAAGIADTNQYLTDQEQQLQRLLGSLRVSKDAGLSQLENNFNTEKLSGENKYGQQFEDNTRSKMGALNAVDTKARTGNNSLQRLLGMSGSAGQSANMVANSAVARQASQDRASQLENSATNERNITNSRDSFLQDLLNKRKEREQSINTDYLTNEQDLTGKIADVAGQRAQVNGGNYAAVKAARAPYQATIDDRQNQLDGLFSKYATPFNAEAKLADLGQFNVDQTAINANKQFGQMDGSPYAAFLAKKRQATV